ncbi:Hypothetical predicted protein [Paramuricea clavata]|uniref:Uncharacterized protein n=1 Tax=Paramuricea clavata TaxID=317549 RepID=A0A7D9IE84_PARCT|nr:Hypothetical predicted protein [Paramuricea clavata]
MAAKLSVEEVLNKFLEGNADTNQEQIRCENDDESSNVLTLPEISKPGIPHMLFSLNINAGKSILAVKEFLSALSMTEVSGYLERRLSGNRKDHLTKLLVSEIKDFALIYHSKHNLLYIVVMSPL